MQKHTAGCMVAFQARKPFDPMSTRASEHGSKRGKFKAKNCYMCRKYYHTNYKQTHMHCPTCLPPLCSFARTLEDVNRHMTCFEEHLSTEDPLTRCDGLEKFNFPKKLRLTKNPTPILN